MDHTRRFHNSLIIDYFCFVEQDKKLKASFELFHVSHVANLVLGIDDLWVGAEHL